jgi:hypothetical protein
MEPNDLEINLDKVYHLLEEVKTGVHVDSKKYGSGFHPQAYNKGLDKRHLDKKVRELCTILTRDGIKPNASLELQIWWRDHQEADRLRKLAEIEKEKKTRLKNAALAKLSPEERAALGLK